ncbi:MAG: TetR family transcriptional regulator, partial [Nocardioides sp.]|nr:TetR family transcriptional regulator [Nocardioides sp.]
MPRIAESRPPAEPSSPGQKDRYRRILRAAARHGAERGMERMQMHDVAKDAGVAIATLYRYFPSKTHLFTAIMSDQVRRVDAATTSLPPGHDPVEAVTGMLNVAMRQLLSTPLLAHAMMVSNNNAVAERSDDAQATSFVSVILRTAGVAVPDQHQLRLVRLVEQAWYGIII